MNKINNKEVTGNLVAYDGCHKIYIIEDEEDLQNAKEIGYSIYPISEIHEIWNNSCNLRFINNWKLTKSYITQDENWESIDLGEDIKFEIEE